MDPGGPAGAGGPCEASTGNGTVPDVEFDDPRSQFNGTGRFVDINAIRIENAGGPIWYTDAMGCRGSTTPFPGSIRQVISPVDRHIGVDLGGPSIGGDRQYYGDPGVRSPN